MSHANSLAHWSCLKDVNERCAAGLFSCIGMQVSFVNSICTVKGGTHVNHVVDQITK